jgi:hypothetical protein
MKSDEKIIFPTRDVYSKFPDLYLYSSIPNSLLSDSIILGYYKAEFDCAFNLVLSIYVLYLIMN